MPKILLTGMSGAGKSSALHELASRGHEVLDTDHGGWIVYEAGEPRWDEPRMRALLQAPGTLFLAGTVINQAAFYPHLHAVVLLTAPLDVLLSRVRTRANPYGRTEADRAAVARDTADVEPLLRRSATHVLDTTRPLSETVWALEELAQAASGRVTSA